VLAGDAPGDEGTIALNLSKISSVKDGWRMIAAKKGKDAVTHWRVIERRLGTNGAPLTLIEFRPETGRTHQIRVHALTGLGHPLLGDPIYGEGKPGNGAKRTMLHAASIAVVRGDKPPIVARAPMPADFAALGFAEPALPEPVIEPAAAPIADAPDNG
jgi:tRNA pseudouridine32 synthase/23S rRNA pseudouridine746 synthase